MTPPAARPAAFFDRDGTLIESVHYLADPALVRLIPGVARALVDLAAAGLAVVVVTNQAAIGKGLLTEDRLAEIHRELDRQLAEHGAAVDAYYHCPTPGTTDDRTAVECADRKPGPGMLRRAAADLGLDLARSWMVGDAVSDALAGHHAGCYRSLLVGPKAHDEMKLLPPAVRCSVVRDVAHAAEVILAARAAR